MALILIIDDEVAFAEVLTFALRAKGHETAIATDGLKGMEIVEARHPAIVITDILMPNFDGIETIRALKKISPETRIIAVSGGHERGYDYLGSASTFGADAVLQKPFRTSEIVDAVRRLLN
jgi:CheY-like chemotaxis protein